MLDRFICRCENCQRLLYEEDVRYLIKFRFDELCFCDNCVVVINPLKDNEYETAIKMQE